MELIKPYKSEDGITFYISNDGNQTGISIAGLERLLGFTVNNSSMFTKTKILQDLVDGTHREDIPESLKPVWGKVFNPTGIGSDGAKIITSKAAVRIIRYYALEKGNKIAVESLSKFAEIGFDTWVKALVNYSKSENTDTSRELLDLMKLFYEELTSVKSKVNKLDNLEGITATIYPGAKLINDGISDEENKLLLEDKNLYTTKDWLGLNQIELDKSNYHSFSLLAAETYRTLTGKNPAIKWQQYITKKGKKNYKKEGNGYRLIDFYILEAAFKKLTAKF